MTTPIRKFHETYWAEVPKTELTCVYAHDIPMQKLINVTRTYAPISVGVEPPLLLLDNTTFGSAKSGLLLTEKAIYYRFTARNAWFKKEARCVPLDTVKELALHSKRDSQEIAINGEGVAVMSFTARERVLLKSYFTRLSTGQFDVEEGSVAALIYPERVSPLIAEVAKAVENSRDYLINLHETSASDETFRFASFNLAFTSRRVIGKDKLAGLGAFRKVYKHPVRPHGPIPKSPLATMVRIGRTIHAEMKDEYAVGAEFGKVTFPLGVVQGKDAADALEAEFIRTLTLARKRPEALDSAAQ